ncbi:MAG: methionine ABC transporter permease [Erysipelotrichales bacterium]|nr:methionine ABC transporter permease [Erysipelotrichales bacterium]
MDLINLLLKGTLETLIMVSISWVISYLFGIPLGVILVITKDKGIKKNKVIYQILEWIINTARSIPFFILMVLVIPLTRSIVGTSIGTIAFLVPLTLGATPFIARMVETSLEEVSQGVVEAAQAMGANTWQIVTKVYLKESIPSLIRGGSITTIALIGYSAMAGVVGGNGLGDIAIRYGLHRYQTDIMIYTLIILIVMVQVIQIIFNCVAKKIDKRK